MALIPITSHSASEPSDPIHSPFLNSDLSAFPALFRTSSRPWHIFDPSTKDSEQGEGL